MVQVPESSLIAMFLLCALLGGWANHSGYRRGVRSERKRLEAIGAGDQPSVRQRLFRQAWQHYADNEPKVIIVPTPVVGEPNVTVLDPPVSVEAGETVLFGWESPGPLPPHLRS